MYGNSGASHQVGYGPGVSGPGHSHVSGARSPKDPDSPSALRIIGAPLNRRRRVVIRPTGPGPFVALVVFGMLFAGLTVWRLGALEAISETPSRSTRSSVPVITDSTPTEADNWCLLVKERALYALREANRSNSRELYHPDGVTPDDIDSEAFGPDGFMWYLDDGVQTFYMVPESMRC